MVVMFLLCVQEVAGLKEEDLTNVNYKCNLTSADKPCSTSLSESQYTHYTRYDSGTSLYRY